MPRRLLIAVAAAAAIALMAVAGGCGGGKADQVRFQNASDPGPKPFTPPTDVPKGSSTVSTSTSSSSSSSSSGGSSGGSGSQSGSGTQSDSSTQSGQGQKRGAFTARNTVCDREKLISALAADQGKLKAWADALGVDADQQSVAEYIRKLKPSTLTRDTQVTSHSYENGKATDYQAILRKGTAVLVDDSGKPVARCVCGNPLTEPQDLEQTTKCINCPQGYQPSASQGGPCEEGCFRPVPNPPPTLPITDPPLKPNTNPIDTAKAALEKCKKDKGGLDKCKGEYEATRKLCAADPLNKACDSSICFDAIVDFSSDGCASYLDRGDILGQCLKLDTAQKQDCLKRLDDLQKKCAASPTDKDCVADPKIKAFRLRRLCLANAGRPECKAVVLDCVRNEGQFGCQDLKSACDAKPDRPDCTAVREFRVSCLKTPNLPECSGVTPPTAGQQQQQLQQTPDQQNQQGGTGTEQPDQGGGTGGTGGATGGTGETPDQGGQQQPQQQPDQQP